MTVKTKAILGSVVASFLAMGQGNALPNPFAKKPAPTAQGPAGNVPEGYENLKSTYIYPTTQKLVNIFNSAKSPKDALDKLCGKSLMSSGEFRKNAGASCKSNPHSAVIVLNICAAYPGFDKSDCAQNAKKLLWPGEENQPLNTLMMKPIKSIAVKEIGVDKFTNEFAQIKDNVDLTPAEELKKYVNPKNLPAAELAKFEMTNIRYLICKSKRSNLPISLQNMLDGGSCTAILQAAGKVQANQGAMLQQGPSLIPMESEPKTALGNIEINEALSPEDKEKVIIAQQECKLPAKDLQRRRMSLKPLMDTQVLSANMTIQEKTVLSKKLDSSNNNEVNFAANEVCKRLKDLFEVEPVQ